MSVVGMSVVGMSVMVCGMGMSVVVHGTGMWKAFQWWAWHRQQCMTWVSSVIKVSVLVYLASVVPWCCEGVVSAEPWCCEGMVRAGSVSGEMGLSMDSEECFMTRYVVHEAFAKCKGCCAAVQVRLCKCGTRCCAPLG